MILDLDRSWELRDAIHACYYLGTVRRWEAIATRLVKSAVHVVVGILAVTRSNEL